jgi:hypothetical protein
VEGAARIHPGPHLIKRRPQAFWLTEREVAGEQRAAARGGQARQSAKPPSRHTVRRRADSDQQLRAADKRVRVPSHRPAARCDSTAPRASGQRPAAARSLQARQSAKPPARHTVRQHRPKASGQRPAAARSRQARQSAKPPSSRTVQQHRPKASGQRPAAARSRQARQSAKPPSRRAVRQHRPKSQRTETSSCAQPTGASECQATVKPQGTTAPPQKPADSDQQLRAAYRRVRVPSHRPAARCDSTAPRASGQRPAAARSLQARQSVKPPSRRAVRQHRPERVMF